MASKAPEPLASSSLASPSLPTPSIQMPLVVRSELLVLKPWQGPFHSLA